MPPVTPLLDTVSSPADIRGYSVAQLRQLADEVRAETIDAVSQTGGHLGAGLGVVELTVALHHVYQTPEDILIWDVGHQAYPHKILTGRRAEGIQVGAGLAGQEVEPGAGVIGPQQGDEVRLAARGVLACRLADHPHFALEIQEVIDDLVGEAQVMGEGQQGVTLRLAGMGHHERQLEGGRDQGPGL